LVIHSCDDDGNLIQDISFESVTTTQSCTNGIIYKLKDQEAFTLTYPLQLLLMKQLQQHLKLAQHQYTAFIMEQ
jgi:hypothetical protein